MSRRHWREFGGRHRRFGGRGRRQNRPFDHGDLRYVILTLIAEKPRHGYEIIKAIEERLGGMYSPSPGVVYPTLTLLEDLGYVAVTPVGSKKEYTITTEGSAFLESNRAVVDAILARLADASRAYGSGPAPEILRAMHNLQFALSVRLGKGPLTAAQIAAITATLDRAASEIERH